MSPPFGKKDASLYRDAVLAPLHLTQVLFVQNDVADILIRHSSPESPEQLEARRRHREDYAIAQVVYTRRVAVPAVVIGTVSLNLVTATFEGDEQDGLTRGQRFGFTKMVRLPSPLARILCVEPLYLSFLRLLAGA